jgi:hypothetical protein
MKHLDNNPAGLLEIAVSAFSDPLRKIVTKFAELVLDHQRMPILPNGNPFFGIPFLELCNA